jgi:hypothetical protein
VKEKMMKIKIKLNDVKYRIFLLLFALSLFSNYYLILNFLKNINEEARVTNISNEQKILRNNLIHKYELIQKNNNIIDNNDLLISEYKIIENKNKLDLMKFLENNVELSNLKSEKQNNFLTFKNQFNINIEEVSLINKTFEDLFNNINNKLEKTNLQKLNNDVNTYYNKLINDNLNINEENFYIAKLLIASTLFITLLLLLILFDITINTDFEKVQKESSN